MKQLAEKLGLKVFPAIESSLQHCAFTNVGSIRTNQEFKEQKCVEMKWGTGACLGQEPGLEINRLMRAGRPSQRSQPFVTRSNSSFQQPTGPTRGGTVSFRLW
jgi:hypothetical protein